MAGAPSMKKGDTPEGFKEDFPGAETGWVFNDTFGEYQKIGKGKGGKFEATGKFRQGRPPTDGPVKEAPPITHDPKAPPPDRFASGGMPQMGGPSPEQQSAMILSRYGVQMTGDPAVDQQQIMSLINRMAGLQMQGMPPPLADEVVKGEQRYRMAGKRVGPMPELSMV